MHMGGEIVRKSSHFYVCSAQLWET
jgi:hypothetical protein